VEVSAGQLKGFEFWRLIYREPSDCLIEVFTARRKLVRTSYYHRGMLNIDAGKVKQQFQSLTPMAWPQITQFLGLRLKPGTVTDYREIFPGAWIPNTFGSAPAKVRKFGVQQVVTFALINTDVDAEFLKQGH
jgi:hypothetical protein